MLSSLFVVLMCFASCSNDEPTPDNKDWQDELYTRNDLIYAGDINQRPTGLNYEPFTACFKIVDASGRDLLNKRNEGNVADSDFHFEINGQKYFVGDTVKGVFPPTFVPPYTIVRIEPDFWGECNFLHPFLVYPFMSGSIRDMTEPMDVTFSFVWPEKDIRKTIRVYCEKNSNLEEDIENAEIDNRGFKHVPLFKYGIWVDGVSTEGNREITIVV